MDLQGLADEIGIPIRVCHFPPGTSKWNKIEYRLFSFIAMNWRGEPLISHEVMLNLIANTKTKTGLSEGLSWTTVRTQRASRFLMPILQPSTWLEMLFMETGIIPFTQDGNMLQLLFYSP